MERAPFGRAAARPLLAILVLYTLYTTLPFLWIGWVSPRITAKISANHYALPSPMHWKKFRGAWVDSGFASYFWSSTAVISAMAIVTILGAGAAHALARYRLRGNRLILFILFILFSSVIFPPQVALLSLLQALVNYGLHNRRTAPGPRLCLAATAADGLHPGSVCPHPAGPVRGGADRRLHRSGDLPPHRAARGHARHRHHRHPQLRPSLERVSLRRGARERRGPADPACRHPALHGDYFQNIGMIATGVMIAGLESISSGRLAIDGRMMNTVPAKDRDIAWCSSPTRSFRI
jgi:hypothetical protein